MPNFFLSSAAGDDDPYVRQLFEDLRRRVASHSTDQRATLSYLSVTDPRAAAPPADALLRLASCDVFVALVSPRYLRNASCGRQWQIFADRLTPGADPAPMIPVAWAGDAETPAGIGTPMTPTDDGSRGLRQLIRLRSLRQDYETFAEALARRIVSVGASDPAPSADPVADFAAVPNAFTPPAADPRVHVVVAAASRAEMDRIREDLDYYGDDGRDWAPYRPDPREPLADRARLIAADRALHAEVSTLDGMADRIERARADHEIVVILCDWWLTQLDDYRTMLADIDRRGLGDAAMLVPASSDDAETMDNLPRLRFGFRRTFRRSSGQSHSLMRTEIGDTDAFDADLAGVLEEARNRLFRAETTGTRDNGVTVAKRPILRGP
ncbi:FxsC protein [Mangrovihabitans endophyticus]|uniref:FxsC C-terminal domain-containing protein n=1 Tax=Mangrovihabitans endophyticus TaxID=1751298 RepID=A0A8J3BVI3_9ACTN|nr:FxsC protein [Mangrovihabitans endophyticus]GGK72258.1 hypothetical protein GCM10012284_02580 [Mangrovihabitans endophyticus]